MRLFIAEKPSMGEEIAKVLGSPQRKNGYFEIGDDIVTWAFGHILKQLDPEEYDPKLKDWNEEDLPIFPQWQNKVVEDCEKQFFIIKDLINKSAEIVHAGDPDREGRATRF
jgi:Topoisomerase IA